MLPSYQDCPRRTIARSYRMFVEERGFTVRSGGASIGATVGTGAHAGAAHLLISKRDGTPCREADAAEIGIVEFRRCLETEGETVWDATTGNSSTAEKQLVRMTSVFYHQVLPVCLPREVESQRKAQIQPDVFLQGRTDLETDDNDLHDLKFGSVPRFYIGQFGGYSLLRRSHGGTIPRRLIMDHIPRVKISAPQPAAVQTLYDPSTAEKAAWATIGFIVRDLTAFLATGDPWTIPANPTSNLCSEKYCPAWGTTFCTLKGCPEVVA